MPATTEGQTILTLCTSETFPAFLDFVAKHNADPSQWCLMFDDTPEKIKGDLVFYGTDPFKDWWGYYDPVTGNLAGVGGLEVHLANKRAEIHGPWGVDAKAQEIVLRELVEALAPVEVESFDCWHNVLATSVSAVLKKYGFVADGFGTFLTMKKPLEASAAPRPADSTCTVSLIPPTDKVNVPLAVNLHKACFKKLQFGMDQFLTLDGNPPGDGTGGWLFGCFDHTVDASRPVFCGYSVVRPNNTPDSVYIDYVGICPEFRAKGKGTALLNAIKDWFMADDSKIELTLTVNGDNTHAKRLYTNIGFVVKEEGMGHRFVRGKAAKEMAAQEKKTAEDKIAEEVAQDVAELKK